ncbi:putative coiled-coil domain-containing protein 195 [Spheniscus humboldti]
MEGNAHLLQVIRKMRSQINKLERENRALRGELQVCGQRAVPPEREAARGGGNGDVRSLANGGEGPAGSPASLHGSIVAGPAPAPKEQTGLAADLSSALNQPPGEVRAVEKCPRKFRQRQVYENERDERLNSTNTTMTVRRYSTASPAPAPSSARSHRAGKRPPPSNGHPGAPGSTQPPAPPAAAHLTGGEEKGLEKSPASCLCYSHSSKMKLFQEHVCKCRGKVKAVSFLLPMDMSSYAEKQGSLKSPQNQSTKQLTTIAEKDM